MIAEGAFKARHRAPARSDAVLALQVASVGGDVLTQQWRAVQRHDVRVRHQLVFGGDGEFFGIVAGRHHGEPDVELARDPDRIGRRQLEPPEEMAHRELPFAAVERVHELRIPGVGDAQIEGQAAQVDQQPLV